MATWWQVTVALSGDPLGWVYSVMWPCFAVFGVVFWWSLVHDDPDTVGRRGLRRLQRQRTTAPGDDDLRRELALAEAEAEDPALAEYNAYLADLARSGRSGTWRAP